MTDDRRPPPPGPRPEPFTYPFAAMAEARRAALAAASQLERLAAGLERSADHATVGFEGDARREFDQLFGASLEGVREIVRRLRDQAAQVADDHVTARARERAADEELAAWDATHRLWLAHR